MDRHEQESRRALNQIWNGASCYHIAPELEALDTQGNAQLYFNTVLGLAWRYYDVSCFRPMLQKNCRSGRPCRRCGSAMPGRRWRSAALARSGRVWKACAARGRSGS